MPLGEAGAERRPMLAALVRNRMAADWAADALTSLAATCIAVNSITVKNRIFFMNVSMYLGDT